MATKSKRVKPNSIVPVNDIKDVDSHLFKIAQFQLQLKRIDADAEEQINNIREQAAGEAEPIKAEIEKLENGIFAYSEFDRVNLFARRKTIELNFGFIGYRQSTKISIKKSTIEKLKEMEMLEAIVVKETANKDVLATYPDEVLKQCDARRIIEDKFWYEVKEEEITSKSGKQVAQQ